MFRQHGAAAGIGVFGLAAAIIIAPAAAQAADPGPGTYAEGRFLAGTLAGSDLQGVLALDPATAVNDGSRPVAEERNPFSATALDAVTVDPGSVEVEGVDGARTGLIGQYAIARDDGTAYASSGLIGANGAIGVSPAAGAVAVIDLAALLGDSLPAGLTGLRLEAAGIAAEAEAGPGGHRGDYVLADARLVLDVPALAATRDQAETTATRLEDSVLDLGDGSGPLAGVVDRILASVGLSGLADVDVSIDADLDGVLAALGDTMLRDDAITVDLAAGTVTVDLAELPQGAGLGDLEPGTELIRDEVVDDVVAGVQRLLDGWLDEVRLRLREAIDDAGITVSAHARVLDEVRTGEIVRTVTTPVTEIVDALTGDSLGTLDPVTGAVTSTVPSISADVLGQLLIGTAPTGPLGGLLEAMPTVTTRTTATVSTVTEPVLSTLETGADVVVSGTLAGLRGGRAGEASATAVVLGAPVQLDASLVVDGLAEAIGSALPASGAAPSPAENATRDVAGIVGIADLVSLRTNVQSAGADGSFTQTALRVEVLGDVATIDLANATVGPFAVPGGTGGGTDPGPRLAAGGGLALTGLALGLIVLVGALCVAVGAVALWRSHSLAVTADAGGAD